MDTCSVDGVACDHDVHQLAKSHQAGAALRAVEAHRQQGAAASSGSILGGSTRKLRIALVIESGGGSGRHVVDLARELAELGHDVGVLYSSKRMEAGYLDELSELPLLFLVPFGFRREVGLHDLGHYFALNRMLSALGPFDVLHSHSSKAGALVRLGRVSGAKVYTPHAFRTMDPTLSQPTSVVLAFIERVLARYFTDQIIAVSQEEARHAIELGAEPTRVSVVLNGIRPSTALSRESARHSLGRGDDELVFGFVGRLTHQKDPVRFARAIQLARQSEPMIHGVLFGDGELRGDVARVGAEGVSIFSGLRAESYLQALDVFCMTSLYEGMPYALVEATHAGLPIISTDVGGVAAAARSNVNAIVLPALAEPAEIAEQMVLLARDSALQSRLREGSIELAETMTAKEMGSQTLAVYDEAIKTAVRSNGVRRP